MAEKSDIGRLAFRVEGEFWNAYLAPLVGMKDAVLLGSIKFSLVDGHIEVKNAFVALMKLGFAEACRVVFGEPATFNDATPAPEIERAGLHPKGH